MREPIMVESLIYKQKVRNKGMTQVKIGQMIVDDYGISKVIKIDDLGGYTSELIIPKEIFMEAYKKWIEPQKSEANNG